jgi:purine-nucleoside phosphorylase
MKNNVKLNKSEIIKPFKPNNFKCGKVAFMAATDNDIKLLCGLIKADKNKAKKLYYSKIYFGAHEFEGVSLVGPFMGSPYAVMLLETLIAAGAEKIILIGWCGSIAKNVKIGDIVIPSSAFIDEGCSKSYEIEKDTIYADDFFYSIENIAKNFDAEDINIHIGSIWTTDAIYRETIEKVQFYQEKKALAVEMETSALFSAGAFRKIQVCAILTVSDELYSLKWKPGFLNERFLKGRETSCRLLMNILNFLNKNY